jgi:hypothetical protein
MMFLVVPYPIGVLTIADHSKELWPCQIATVGCQEEKTMSNAERIAQLEKEIEEMKARLPKHSVPPSLIIELEELEEELEMLRARESRGTD